MMLRSIRTPHTLRRLRALAPLNGARWTSSAGNSDSKQSDEVRDVVIVGSGPAGYTAALYTARAFLKPLMLAGAISGGQLMLTSEVENFPGYPKGITGPELIQDLREQALRFDAEIRNESVVSVDFSSRPFRVATRDSAVLANTVIISTGADALWLNAKHEDALRSNGVSTCATCDGFFYRGKAVLVAGGGDTAMEEALYLANLAKSVTVVHRRGEFRASKVMRERVLNHPKIQVKYHRVVDEWIGTAQDGLKGAVLRDPRNGSTEEIAVDGAFVAIGHKPNTEFLKGHIDLDAQGYIKLKEHTMTSVAGVFAAGDVTDIRYRQAITAAAMGCMAAIDAERWLAQQNLH